MPRRRHRGKPAPKTTPPRLIGRGPASWSQSKAAIHQAKPRPTTRLVLEAESGRGFGQCGLAEQSVTSFPVQNFLSLYILQSPAKSIHPSPLCWKTQSTTTQA